MSNLAAKAVKLVFGLMLTGLLVACGGGGGNSGDPVVGGGPGGGTGGGGTATASDLAVVLDQTTLASDGNGVVNVTVTSLDANRNAIGGVPVSFTIDNGGVVTPSGTSTDSTTGQLKATAGFGSDRTNRTLTVTVKSGGTTQTVTFDVVDSVAGVAKASDLSLLLDQPELNNSGSGVVNVTVTAVDASRNVKANIPVTFSVNNGATIAVLNGTTDARGQAKAEVRVGDDKSERLITVTAKSDTLVRTAVVAVTGVTIQSVLLPAILTTGATGLIEYRVIDTNSNGMANVDVAVSGAGLPSVTGKTDSNGGFKYSYTAPATPGVIAVTARAAGDAVVQNLTVTSTGGAVGPPIVVGPTPPPPLPAVPPAPTLSVAPSVVRANLGAAASGANRTEIRALFLDPATNAPIKNMRVRFDLDGDRLSIGGAIGSGDTVVYTDASGAAVTNYTPADRPSPTNGVTIRACYGYTDTDVNAGACTAQSKTTLTVVSDPLSVSIGTDNTIEIGDSKLTYVKKFVILVVDAAGNPKSDVQLTPLIDILGYGKGFYEFDEDSSSWGIRIGNYIGCSNEDLNRNGAIDAGEDINLNGQLDPRKSDVSISFVGSTKTDANGTAILRIEYPQSIATWISAEITVTAGGVLSPPARILRNPLDALASAFKNKDVSPPFQISPYGTTISCNSPR